MKNGRHRLDGPHLRRRLVHKQCLTDHVDRTAPKWLDDLVVERRRPQRDARLGPLVDFRFTFKHGIRQIKRREPPRKGAGLSHSRPRELENAF